MLTQPFSRRFPIQAERRVLRKYHIESLRDALDGLPCWSFQKASVNFYCIKIKRCDTRGRRGLALGSQNIEVAKKRSTI